MTTKYQIEDHMHHFACWTAARAAIRGFSGGSNEAVENLIHKADLRESLSKRVRDTIRSKSDFDVLHERLRRTLNCLNSELGFGRASKIIAIYIKTAIIPFEPYSEFSRFAHPPVDSILLTEIQKKGISDIRLKSPWTKYKEDQYNEVIEILWNARGYLEFEYFWQIERHWKSYR